MHAVGRLRSGLACIGVLLLHSAFEVAVEGHPYHPSGVHRRKEHGHGQHVEGDAIYCSRPTPSVTQDLVLAPRSLPAGICR